MGLHPARHKIRYPSGSVLFSRDDEVDRVYLITSGAVKLVRSEDGTRDAIVALRFPESFLGLAPAILRERHPETAVALGSCEVQPIDAAVFHSERAASRVLAAAVEQALAAEILQQGVRVSRTTLDARARLISLLADLAMACGQPQPDGAIRLEVHLTQADLAAPIGVSRERVNHLLADLDHQGFISRRGGGLVVLRRARQFARDHAADRIL